MTETFPFDELLHIFLHYHLGSFFYPVLRSRIGLCRTGLYSLGLQLSCISLCVVSIWLPGSPFDPVGYFGLRRHIDTTNTTNINDTIQPLISALDDDYQLRYKNVTDVTPGSSSSSSWSIWVFIAGVTLARFGNELGIFLLTLIIIIYCLFDILQVYGWPT